MDAFGLFIALLSRTHNIFALLIISFQILLVSKSLGRNLNPLMILAHAHLIFYIFGNSNSLGTIDLSNSYVGIESENMAMAGILTFFATAGPTLYVMNRYLLCYIKESRDAEEIRSFVDKFWGFSSHWRLLSIASLSLAVTFFRDHLFIWSVFMPKYFYEVSWLTIFHCVSLAGSIQILFGWISGAYCKKKLY